MVKKRLDVVLVERGLETTRARAQARILAGDVIVGEHRVDKAGHLVDESDAIRLKDNSLPYVSRGGLKLEAALKAWPASIKDAICMDVGASTGGFTDVLLQAGAKSVYAVDVGTNQLAYSLRIDPRVHVFEKTHILKVPENTFEPKPSIAVIDVSFISLEKVLPAVLKHVSHSAVIYALIKPQFEVGPDFIEKGGIVKNQAAREAARDKILQLAQNLGLEIRGHKESPIRGTEGNIEYLACFAG
jgi:23S rRNA (cytidine1920-2'-O)/16S rRNA (cytidine1409-2'-O)-methyltransferase